MLERIAPAAKRTWESDDLPVSIVIPLYNEQQILNDNLKVLARFFDQMLGAGNWLFVLVDNGSTDRTPQLVKEAIERWPQSRGIHLVKPNYGEALKVGLRSVRTNWVYMLDIEQWDLPFMTWAWRNRDLYDLFIASKRADPTINFQQPYRKFLSCCLNAILQLLFGFSGADTHGSKLLNRTALAHHIDACVLDRGQFDTELVIRAFRSGHRLIELPAEYRESRPQRNLMIKKIVWNLFAIGRLYYVMKNVPILGHVRYYRVTREDVLAVNQSTFIGEKGRV